MDNESQKVHNYQDIVENSLAFADNVIKRLVAHTLKKDVNELFDTCIDTRGQILIHDSNSDKKYLMGLDIVDKDYMLDLGAFQGNEDVKNRMIFLLNAVKVLYCPIKEHMKSWASENETTFNYVLQLGLNTTLFLDKETEKRIGIILNEINEN